MFAPTFIIKTIVFSELEIWSSIPCPLLYDVIQSNNDERLRLYSGAVINVLGSLAAVFIFVFPGVHDVLYILILCLLSADN